MAESATPLPNFRVDRRPTDSALNDLIEGIRAPATLLHPEFTNRITLKTMNTDQGIIPFLEVGIDPLTGHGGQLLFTESHRIEDIIPNMRPTPREAFEALSADLKARIEALHPAEMAQKGAILSGIIGGAIKVPEAPDEDMEVIPLCLNCGKSAKIPGVSLKKFAKCQVGEYCSRDCQKKDWKYHKTICRVENGGTGDDYGTPLGQLPPEVKK